MPTYEYACDACGHKFEEFQSITAAPLKKCPACDKRSLRRLLGTGAGVIFKGSGFYQTDYRSDSYKKAVEAETKASTSGSDSKYAKSPGDAKTAASASEAKAGGKGDTATKSASKPESTPKPTAEKASTSAAKPKPKTKRG